MRSVPRGARRARASQRHRPGIEFARAIGHKGKRLELLDVQPAGVALVLADVVRETGSHRASSSLRTEKCAGALS
jgi:hypothetical protein